MSTRHREPRKIQSSPRSRGKRWTKTKERGKGERERGGDTALRIDVRPMEHILQSDSAIVAMKRVAWR